MNLATAKPIATANPRAVMFCGDSTTVMHKLAAQDFRVDVVWADPPYYLSDGGTTCSGGKRASVDKGDWDKPLSRTEQTEVTRAWLHAVGLVLKPTGSIWVCGTLHNVFGLGMALGDLEFRILNAVVWQKTNPPPNLACRSFTHSHESLLWASLGPKATYYFDYRAIKASNGNKQLCDVWRMPGPTTAEYRWGRHSCQKPTALIRRCLLASCPPEGTVLDPFAGSGSTGVATLQLGKRRRFVGIEQDERWVNIAVRRLGAARVRRD